MGATLDETALALLRPALVKQAHRQLRDEHEAEDVAQDALVALCTTTTCFSDLDHVTAYARRTVHNLCVDRIRRRIRHVGLESADHSYDTLEHEVITRDVIAAVVIALAEINPIYAQVLVASTDIGRNHAEIAAVTGVSLRNVRHGLDRGAKALKAKLVAAGHTVPAVLTPLPFQQLLARLKATSQSRRTLNGTAIAGALPALLLLLPHFVGPVARERQTAIDENLPAVVHSVDTSGVPVPAVGRRLVTLVDPFNDAAFAQDAAKLLGSTDKLKPDQCALIGGHGVCQTDPNPAYRYYTVNVPSQTGLPDIQVYGSDLPPCDSTVPENPEITCEQGHPPVPMPIPTPSRPTTP